MEESEAIKLLAEWEKIISPQDCDNLLFWLSHWIDDIEEALTLVEGVVNERRIMLINSHKTVAMADAYLKIDEYYQKRDKLENSLRRYKAARSNVRRRYDLITNRLLQTQRRY